MASKNGDVWFLILGFCLLVVLLSSSAAMIYFAFTGDYHRATFHLCVLILLVLLRLDGAMRRR